MHTSQNDVPRLRWVVVEGDLHEVSEFSSLAPKARPEAFCPVCERPVTLKLGKKKAHHFAHQPEDACPATKPETAIHLNCKFHIYHQLKASQHLYTTSSCKRCGIDKRILWKENWDDVVVEYRMNALRPDIALLKEGKVIGAIEVFVTHAVSDEKAFLLRNEGVDWIEVLGREEVYEGTEAWRVPHALKTLHQTPEPETWLCPPCTKIVEREEYRRTHKSVIVFARIIDCYFRSGKKYRYTFYVKHEYTEGEKTRIFIEDHEWRLVAEQRSPLTEQSQASLNEAFKRNLSQLVQKSAVVDHDMPWTPWREGQKFVPWDFDKFPYRYTWHQLERKWVLQPHLQWKKLT